MKIEFLQTDFDFQQKSKDIMKAREASENVLFAVGKWVVNDRGDVVYASKGCSHYFLYGERIENWDYKEMYDHISRKTWFHERQPQMGIEFKEIIGLAREIIRKNKNKGE